MPKRKPARLGLSYVDANSNRLITETADVTGYKREIMSRWPELEVVFDSIDEEWVIIEHCKDGVDRHVLSTEALGQHIVDQLVRAESETAEEMLARIDAENEALEKEQESKFADQIGDFGERFVHALRKDGYMDHEDIYGLRSKPNESRQSLNRGKAVRI